MNENKLKVCLLGASFDTGNLGVSALSESIIKCITRHSPNADITFLASGNQPGLQELELTDNSIILKKIPIRFNKNFFSPYHFLTYVFYGLVFRLLPFKKVKMFCSQRNEYLKTIIESDLVADITGGDSFSDIYGMRRFTLGFLRKWVIIFLKKQLIMLPQTYGPYYSKLSKLMARYILNRSSKIYCRDKEGIEYLKTLLNNKNNQKMIFKPDVAFVLDSKKTSFKGIDDILRSKAKNNLIAGFNVSGLLYYGGYTKDNMFGLSFDYSEMVKNVINHLISKNKLHLILIPHVIPASHSAVESDPAAMEEILKNIDDKYREKVTLVRNVNTHKEIKYIISLCDVFIGSRMHACIAALSQCIPAIGLAYSKKFIGVFDSVGSGDQVVSMNNSSINEIINIIEATIDKRKKIKDNLIKVIPDVQTNIMGIFNEILCSEKN